MKKDFDGWNEIKKRIEKSEFRDFVHAREVWWCAIGINIGYEQDGRSSPFERPVLILKKFSKDIVLAIPLSTRIKINPYTIIFLHEGRQYSALISQVRLVSTKRLKRKMYKMDSTIFSSIREGVKKII